MNEAELVAALKSGNHLAVEQLVNRYGERLLRSVYLLCGNETDAQDLVQDTLLVAIRSAQRFHGRSALYTWLYGILLNLTRHYHRKRKGTICSDNLPQQKLAERPRPEHADMDRAAFILADAIQRLSPAHREVIIFRYYEGMKIAEIASLVRTTPGTVKSRLHYATRRLRELIPKELNLFRPGGTHKRTKP